MGRFWGPSSGVTATRVTLLFQRLGDLVGNVLSAMVARLTPTRRSVRPRRRLVGRQLLAGRRQSRVRGGHAALRGRELRAASWELRRVVEFLFADRARMWEGRGENPLSP
jgi:hypothetical protein